jgi:hypothetical protein
LELTIRRASYLSEAQHELATYYILELTIRRASYLSETQHELATYHILELTIRRAFYLSEAQHELATYYFDHPSLNTTFKHIDRTESMAYRELLWIYNRLRVKQFLPFARSFTRRK